MADKPLRDDAISTAQAAKADAAKDKGPFVAMNPIRHGYPGKEGRPAEIRYAPGEELDLSFFSQAELDQLKGSGSIGTKEQFAAANKGVVVIGTGDGKTTTFDTPFVRSSSISVFVDGLSTNAFNVAYGAGARGAEQIRFSEAPKSGAAITAKADPGAFDLTTLEAKPKKYEK